MLYDADCSFCRASAGALVAWDRQQLLVPVKIQSPQGETALSDLDDAQRLASFHLITADGVRYSGGPGLGPMFERLPGGRPLATLARRFDRAAGRTYELVSANRSRLVKLIPAPVNRWAERRLAEREAQV